MEHAGEVVVVMIFGSNGNMQEGSLCPDVNISI